MVRTEGVPQPQVSHIGYLDRLQHELVAGQQLAAQSPASRATSDHAVELKEYAASGAPAASGLGHDRELSAFGSGSGRGDFEREPERLQDNSSRGSDLEVDSENPHATRSKILLDLLQQILCDGELMHDSCTGWFRAGAVRAVKASFPGRPSRWPGQPGPRCARARSATCP